MTGRRVAPALAAVALLAGGILPAVAVAAPAGAATTSAAAGPAATGPAQRVLAGPADRPVGVVRTAAATPAAQRAVRARWTPQRMRAARPARPPARPAPVTAEVVTSGRTGRAAAVDATRARLAPARLATLRGVPWTMPETAAVRTTGKVFFSDGGVDYVCSGSAVTTPDESTVLTAGHCVADAGSYVTDWMFVPGYDDGYAPYGTFVASRLSTTAGWLAHDDFDVDVAFAHVGRNAGGLTLGDAVGGQAIAFDRPRGGTVVALGYPAAAPFTGRRLTVCAGDLGTDTVGGSPDHALGCDMTGGSSGGPWFGDFDWDTGRGRILSVTSFGYVGYPGTLYGPYLGGTAKALFEAVRATSAA